MPKSYCAAEGCYSDDWKHGRYGWMACICFFAFRSPANQKRRDMDLIRRRNFAPGKFSRQCTRHCIDGAPSVLHPYPEHFVYINYKEVNDQSGKPSILKRKNITFTPHLPSIETDRNEIRDAVNKQTTSRSYLVNSSFKVLKCLVQVCSFHLTLWN